MFIKSLNHKDCKYYIVNEVKNNDENRWRNQRRKRSLRRNENFIEMMIEKIMIDVDVEEFSDDDMIIIELIKILNEVCWDDDVVDNNEDVFITNLIVSLTDLIFRNRWFFLEIIN